MAIKPTKLALLLLAGLCTAAAASEGAPSLAALPMLPASGLPCVEASADNYPHFTMLVDTGSETSMLDVITAVDMGLDLKPLALPDGKPCPGRYTATVKDVHVGAVAFGDLPVVVVDLRQRAKSGTFPAVDGSLGVAVFRGRVLNLDFKARRVWISRVPEQGVPLPHGKNTDASTLFEKASLG